MSNILLCTKQQLVYQYIKDTINKHYEINNLDVCDSKTVYNQTAYYDVFILDVETILKEEFIEIINKINYKNIIVISSEVSSDFLKTCKIYGIKSLIVKPFNMSTLKLHLEKYI